MKKQIKNTFTLRQKFYGGMLKAAAVLVIASPAVASLEALHPVVASAQEAALTEHEQIITNVVDESRDAVVSVSNFQHVMTGEQAFMQFYGLQQDIDLRDFDNEPTLAGSGSGVVYKIDGDAAYIVTNQHVIDRAEKIEVTMADGRTAEAELLGSDSLSDLAVLKISSEYASRTLEFADSDAVKVGSTAIAIGSPIGMDYASSVTKGIISGLNRALPVDTNNDGKEDWEMTLMQTDAAINPGNSGGALVNTSGQLIGINSAKLAASEIEGMGFAIPSNDVQHIISQLETDGEVTRPVLGVTTTGLDRITKESRQEVLNLSEDITEGALVLEVQNGSAAEAAGIENYDVIVEIDGKPIKSSQSLRQELYRHQIGDTIEIKVLRNGKEQTLQTTLNEETSLDMQANG